MKKKAIIFFGIVSLVFGSVFMSIPAKAEKQEEMCCYCGFAEDVVCCEVGASCFCLYG